MQEIKLNFSPLSSSINQFVVAKPPGLKTPCMHPEPSQQINEEDEIFRTVEDEHKASEDMEDLLQEPPHISRKFKFPVEGMLDRQLQDGSTDQDRAQLALCKDTQAQVPLLKLDSFDDKMHIQQLEQQLVEKDKEIERLKKIIEL